MFKIECDDIITLTSDVTISKGRRNVKPGQTDAGHRELQNKLKIIKFGSQEAEIAVGVGKYVI